jgi:hypothetical protein
MLARMGQFSSEAGGRIARMPPIATGRRGTLLQ